MYTTLERQQSKKRNRQLTKDRNKEYIRSYKERYRCCMCGEGQVVCLDLHHTNPNEKSFDFSKGEWRSIKSIEAEMKKCIVVCANCHRLIHAGQRLEGIRLEKEKESMLFCA